MERENDRKAKLIKEEADQTWLKEQAIQRAEERRMEIQKEMEHMKLLEQNEKNEASQALKDKTKEKKKSKKKTANKKGNRTKK